MATEVTNGYVVDCGAQFLSTHISHLFSRIGDYFLGAPSMVSSTTGPVRHGVGLAEY